MIEFQIAHHVANYIDLDTSEEIIESEDRSDEESPELNTDRKLVKNTDPQLKTSSKLKRKSTIDLRSSIKQ